MLSATRFCRNMRFRRNVGKSPNETSKSPNETSKSQYLSTIFNVYRYGVWGSFMFGAGWGFNNGYRKVIPDTECPDIKYYMMARTRIMIDQMLYGAGVGIVNGIMWPVYVALSPFIMYDCIKKNRQS
jgi:hypothetical protein